MNSPFAALECVALIERLTLQNLERSEFLALFGIYDLPPAMDRESVEGWLDA